MARMSRRAFLSRSAATALAVSGGVLLSACGQRDPTGAAPGAGGPQLASPDNPVTWPVPAEAGPHRRRHGPRAGRHPAGLQLERVHLQEGRHRLREEVQEVRRQGAGLHLRQHGRGGGQAPRRPGRLRRAVPHLRLPRQAGPGELPAPPQPLLPPQHRAGLAGLPEPLVRPGLELLGALHDLHHRHRLAGRQGHRRHRQAAQPLRGPLGRAVPRQGRHPRRLPRGHRHDPAQERHHRPQHRQPGPPQPGQGPAGRPGPGGPAPGQHQRLHRPARVQDLDHPGLVGRHGQRPVLHAQGRERRRHALLVPDRRQGPGQQRPDRAAAHGQEPGAGPPVHGPPARLRRGRREHELERLPAAPEQDQPRPSW